MTTPMIPGRSWSGPLPREGDVAFDGEGLTYIAERSGWLWHLDDPAPSFYVIDTTGEEFRVVRAEDRDAQLRAAVHDDGRRLAWRRVKPRA